VNAVDDAINFNVKNVIAAFSPGAAFFAQRQPLGDDQRHTSSGWLVSLTTTQASLMSAVLGSSPL
jgi:hypothetical protein